MSATSPTCFVDLGSTSIKLRLREDGDVLDLAIPTPEALADSLRLVVEALPANRTRRFVVALPGVLDLERGRLVESTRFRVRDLPLASLRDHLPSTASLVVARDSDAAAVGAAPPNRGLHIQLGTGMSAVATVAGLPLHGNGSELGHVDRGGDVTCAAGHRGCLAGQVDAVRDDATPERLAALLADSFAMTVALLAPETVSIGGGLAASYGSDLPKEVEAGLRGRLHLRSAPQPSVALVHDPLTVGLRGLEQLERRAATAVSRGLLHISEAREDQPLPSA